MTQPDVEPRGRLRSTGETLTAFGGRIPFSLALAVTLVVTAILVGTAHGHPSPVTRHTWAAGVTTTFDLHAWWTVFTALVIPWDPFQLVFGVLAAVLLLGVAERRMGTVRTIVAFWATGVVGVLLGTCLQWVGSLAGEWWASGTSLDLTLDPLTGVTGALIAATAFMGPLWRRRVRVVTLATLLVFVLYAGDSSNVYRLIAVLAAYPLGAWFAHDPQALRSLNLRRSSHRETRTLVASIVAVTAIGPIVALLSRARLTPFAFGSYLYRDAPLGFHHVIARCRHAVETSGCIRDVTILSHQGLGMLVLSFLPVALLLAAAWGLRNGRRFALWFAIAVNAAILLFDRGPLDVSYTHDVDVWTAFDVGELAVWVVASALLPIAVIVLLLITRRRFAIRTSRRARSRFWIVVAVTGVVLFVAYYLIGLATISDFFPRTTPLDLLVDTFKRFIPPHFVANVDPIVTPGHGVAMVAYRWVGVLFWTVFIVAALRLMSTRRDRAEHAAGADRLRALIARHGGGTLGFMSTWSGNTTWFNEDGDAAIAYRVVNGIAITMSDPICAPDRLDATVREFAGFCDVNGWTPVFYSVHADALPVFDGLGWQHMPVGEETIVHTTGLELTGKSWQKVRYALNRGIKEGMTTVWASWDELPLAAIVQIEALSEAWVAEKELPEMGFTLGGMDELKDPDVRLMLALDADGTLQAVTSWLPVYRDGAIVGRTLDFMRRVDGSMNGTMEFLIASAALHLKDEGVDILSLSGAPLATAPLAPGESPPPPTAMSRLLDWLARTLEPAYGFSSLFKFKERFNPEYATMYMAYPDSLALPAIGVALGRAYLPDVSPREAVALVRSLSGAGR